jgi:molybdopterin-guanine dinucleotide biosynthesis protein A
MLNEPLPFAGAVLTGGKSSRMGRDKGGLEWGGQPLWRHQLEVLRGVGAVELLRSCGAGGDGLEEPWFRSVPDVVAESGPMGGIAACLAATDAPLLVVLGVDMPMVPGELLRRMASAATARCGVAVRREAEGGRWLWEPLAAVWPRGALGRVEAALAEGRLSLQRLMDELAGEGMMREWVEVVPAEWLANANTPEEWAALGRVM